MNYLENFNLDFLSTEEMMPKLLGKIASDGYAIVGYYGCPYLNEQLGAPQLILRTERNDEKKSFEVVGFDTHMVGPCKWDVEFSGINLDSYDNQKLSRRVVVRNPVDGTGMVVMNLVNADVLPSFMEGEVVAVQVVAFPENIRYYADDEAYSDDQPKDENGYTCLLEDGMMLPMGFLKNHRVSDGESNEEIEDSYEDSMMLIKGTVKKIRSGVVKMGENDGPYFVLTTISTSFGDLDIAHSLDMVDDEDRENLKVGAVVNGIFVISGDVAILDYEYGIIKDEENHLSLLEYTISGGDAERLRTVLSKDVEYYTEYSGETFYGIDEVIGKFNRVSNKLKGTYIRGHKATVVSIDDGERDVEFDVGARCIVIAYEEPSNFETVMFFEMDDDNNICRIHVSTNPRYHFDFDRQPDFFGEINEDESEE